ncbi:MAG: HEAT repeat domain-containing protein, partial [Planctomycetaceae bacterium]
SRAIPPAVTRYTLWPLYMSLVVLFLAGLWSWNTSEVRSVMSRTEESLMKGLQDPNDTIRIFSARSAGTINMGSDRILSALSAGMSDPNVDVRAACALALAEHGAAAKSTIPVLIKLQQTDPSPIVRTEAEKAIEVIRTAQKSSSNTFWGIIALALVIAGFAGYHGIRSLK